MKQDYCIEYIKNGKLQYYYMSAKFFGSVEEMAIELSSSFEIYIKIKDNSQLGYFWSSI